MANKSITPKQVKKEIGRTGTNLSSGIISEDYNNEWNYDKSIENVEKMRKGDPQVQSSLQVLKLPLLTANWVIDIDKEGNEEHKDFVKHALFDDMEISFDDFRQEAMNFLEFGFYYFEKVFKLRDDGLIGWRKFAPRIPSAHLYWNTKKGFGSGKNKNEGITQQLKSSEDSVGNIVMMNPQIPMSKLIVFTHKKEGNNYEGQSVLRTAFKDWKMKDFAEKIQMIAIEREGVGIPMMTIPDNADDDEITAAENICKNLKSNEKSYIVKKKSWDFEIATAGSSGKNNATAEAIKHHNEMIHMNVLATFLMNNNGGGSYAKSKVDIDFFLNALQSTAKYVAQQINYAIKELIIINFGVQDFYPKLTATEIGSIDDQALMNAINTGVQAGVIVPDDTLKDWVRENMNLPERDEEEEVIEQKPKIKEEKKFSSKKKILNFSEIKVSGKEKIFQKNINEHENHLEDVWKNKYETQLVKAETELRSFLTTQYKKSKTEKVAGIETIATFGNGTLLRETQKGVKNIFNKLQTIFEQKNYEAELMKDSAKMANNTMKEMNKVTQLADIIIDAGTLNAFRAGHLSNVKGFVYNEGRRIQERLLDNFTQKASINLVVKQTKNIKMNRNITKLSIVTHPRALFNNLIFTNAEKEGVKKFKVLVPKNKVQDLNPNGKTAELLFKIKTFQQLNNEGNIKSNSNVVGGMGLHHGSTEYYFPLWPLLIIAEYERRKRVEEEERIAEEQRKEFLRQID